MTKPRPKDTNASIISARLILRQISRITLKFPWNTTTIKDTSPKLQGFLTSRKTKRMPTYCPFLWALTTNKSGKTATSANFWAARWLFITQSPVTASWARKRNFRLIQTTFIWICSRAETFQASRKFRSDSGLSTKRAIQTRKPSTTSTLTGQRSTSTSTSIRTPEDTSTIRPT